MNKEEILELNEYLGSAYDLADEFNVQVFCVNTQEFNNKVLLYYYRQVKTIDLLEKENQELKDRIENLKRDKQMLEITVEKLTKTPYEYSVR